MKILKCLALFLAVVLLGTMTVITSSANEATEATPTQKVFTLTGNANAAGEQKNVQKFSLGAGTYTVTVLSKSATTIVPNFFIYAEAIGSVYKLFQNNDSSLGKNLSTDNYISGSITTVDDVKKEYTFTITDAVTENKDIYIGFVHENGHLKSANYEFTWSVAVTNSEGTKFYPADSILYSGVTGTNAQYFDFDYGTYSTKTLGNNQGKLACTDYDETVFYPRKTVTVTGNGTNNEIKFVKKVENVSAGTYKVSFLQKANNMFVPTFTVYVNGVASANKATLTDKDSSVFNEKEYTFNVASDASTVYVGFVIGSSTLLDNTSFSFSNLQLVKDNGDGSYGDNLISWLGYKDWYNGADKIQSSLYTTMNRYLVTISDYSEYDIYPEQNVKFSINRTSEGQQYILKKASLTAGTYTASFAEYGYGISSDKLMFVVRTGDKSVRYNLGEGTLPETATLNSNASSGLNSGEVTFTLNSDTDVYIGFLLYDAARKNNPEFYVTDLRLIKENDDKNLITPISYLDWYEAGDTYTRITNYTSSSRQLKAKFINAGLTDKSGNGGAPDGELDIRDLVAIHKAQMPSAISEETGIYTYTDDNAFGYDLTETRLALLNGVNIPENKPVEKFS